MNNAILICALLLFGIWLIISGMDDSTGPRQANGDYVYLIVGGLLVVIIALAGAAWKAWEWVTAIPFFSS